MAKLTISTFLSLDGVMQAPGGPDEDNEGGFKYGGWTAPFGDEVFNKSILDIYSGIDAFLLGRKTYDIFANYWPVHNDPNNPIAVKLNSLPKFVASRTRSDFEWANTTLVRDVVKEIPEIKKRFRGTLLVHGSSDLAQTLIANDLVDEYQLMFFPVLIGSGKRLFASGTVPKTLELVRSIQTTTGGIFNFYHPAGELKTGTVGE